MPSFGSGSLVFSFCLLILPDTDSYAYECMQLVPYVRTTYVADLYNQIDLEDLIARARGRWRSPPPSLVSLPSPPPRLSLTARSSPPPPYPQESAPSNNTRPTPDEPPATVRTWAYPSSPHPSSLEPSDEFSILPSAPFNLSSDASHQPTSIVRHLQGEELDLLAWERVQGPQTVVCWPYHRVSNIEWWWTRVIEKVKKPFRHLRR